MWRVLLQAGLGAATLNIGGRVRKLKRMAVLFAVAGVLALLGLAALLAALGLLLEPRFGAPAAAGTVGGGVLLLAVIIGWVATWEPRRRAATGAPIVQRVSSELRAAGDALSSSASGPRLPGRGRARGLNVLLIATLAGVVLGRRL